MTEIKLEQIKEFERYLLECEKAKATVQKYVTDVRTFYRYLEKNFLISKQRLLDYKQWLMKMYSVNSVNSMLAALNHFLDFSGLDHLKLKSIKIQKSLFIEEEKELTREEYQRLLKTALDEGKKQLALCMETLACTGIRISELSFFTVEAIKKKYIEIYNKGKYRRIFLPGQLKKKLLKYSREQGIHTGEIFITRNGKSKNRSNIWREMKALKAKAGIDGDKIFPHNLRHLFARIYYEVTRDLAGLGNLLGHSSLNVTRIYTSNTGKIYQKQLDLISHTKMMMST